MNPVIPHEQWLPPIPQPPHDPTSWLINGRTGWRAITPGGMKQIDQQRPGKSLVLAQQPGSQRHLNEPSGSFGGIRLPMNVGQGAGGDIFLLDERTQELKRFDPCDCRFVVIPCIGGIGHEARQFHDAHGIAICDGNLFVCDTGNHRLSVFALRGYVLRGHWRPPASAHATHPALSKEWEPVDVSLDGQGRVYVTDRANDCLHRFAPTGAWQTCVAGLGKTIAVAVDCRDRPCVVLEGQGTPVTILDTNGEIVGSASRVEELASQFPSLDVAVDALGLLHLQERCTPLLPDTCARPSADPVPERGVFDRQGNPVAAPSRPLLPSYVNEGVYISQAWDSDLYRCQWHRIIVRGDIPTGSTVQVCTYTAEALYPDDHITAAELLWETNQVAHGTEQGAWDCLVRSGHGRYLWLKLVLKGNGKVTPRIESITIEFPRVSLRRYLPAVFGEEPTSADFTDRLLSLYDTTIRSIESKIDYLARYFDPLSAPAERRTAGEMDFLTWLGTWVGVAVDRNWPEGKRRQWLRQAGRLFDIRGTREGLRQQLLLLLGIEPHHLCCPQDQPRQRCRPRPSRCSPPKTSECHWAPPALILEHFRLRRWLFVGAGKLGDQAVLWGKRIVNRSQLNEGAQIDRTQLMTTQDPYRDPFHVYAHKFTIFVPASYKRSDRDRKVLENLLKSESPAHTAYQIQYVEPRFRIGFQSMIGFDSVIGRYPQGVTLNDTRLGWGSVVSGGPGRQEGPSLTVGKGARVGSTTRLN